MSPVVVSKQADFSLPGQLQQFLNLKQMYALPSLSGYTCFLNLNLSSALLQTPMLTTKRTPIYPKSTEYKASRHSSSSLKAKVNPLSMKGDEQNWTLSTSLTKIAKLKGRLVAD